MMFYVIFGSIIGAASSLLVLLYFQKKGHFQDLEEVKYQVFRDEEEKR